MNAQRPGPPLKHQAQHVVWAANPAQPSFWRSFGIALLCAGTIYAAGLLLHAIGG